jgi:hypothetical protein
LGILPSGVLPSALNEIPKLLIDLTADNDYISDGDGYYKVMVKAEYNF